MTQERKPQIATTIQQARKLTAHDQKPPVSLRWEPEKGNPQLKRSEGGN